MEFDPRRSKAARLRAIIICLFMTHVAASDSCFTRMACGEIGITRGDCETKGCCYDDAIDAVEPRCFSRGDNIESCDALTERISCRTYERVFVEEREISEDAFGYRVDPNVPLTDSAHQGEVIVEVFQTEASGQLSDEDTTASIEETAVDQKLNDTTFEITSEGQGHDPDETPESMMSEYLGSVQSEESEVETVSESMGSVQSEEFTKETVQIIHGDEGIGEHPVAAPASLGSLEFDASIEEWGEFESHPPFKAARPLVQIAGSEALADLSREQDPQDLDEPEDSFAYGSVGAPASMTELEDFRSSLQTKPISIYKTRSEEMQMPVQKKELAEILRSKTETICTQSSESNIERLGWLVLVNGDEPIELLTYKKESRDDSSKTKSESAHSISPLKSLKSHFAEASIKDASTEITAQHQSEFSDSSSGQKDTDADQAELVGDKKGKANAVDKVNHKKDGILSKNSMTHLNCAISEHIPCGNGRVTKRECREKGCCWKSFSRNLIQAGCYYPQSEVEANAFHLKKLVV